MIKSNHQLKVAISYPPLISKKGIPRLSQNRQFFWSKVESNIYPLIPGFAATLLKQNGFQVFWDDAIAEKLSYSQWIKRIKKFTPDLIMIESKTPVIKSHWQIIKNIKKILPNTKIILVGDHVTALPFESMINCPVDYIATGGDYDFLTLNIANYLSKQQPLEPGIWYRTGKTIKNTGYFLLNHDLNALPLIDRDLTKWQLYAYNNGNYKYTPGTYIASGRDCWWGRCKFCSWTTLYPNKCYRKQKVKKVLDEIGSLINKYKIKEIMDDSGTFPIGQWLKDFCQGMINRNYHKKIRISCNMRINALDKNDFKLMKQAGFRLILFGIESANQKTLNKINKNLTVSQIETTLKNAKQAGLEPHVSIMVGYPWETIKDLDNTLIFIKGLFRKGYINTLQATLLIPYPGTPFFQEFKKNNLLVTEDWNKYDQSQAVIKSPLSNRQLKYYIQQFYRGWLTPRFILNKIIEMKSIDDFKYLLKSAQGFLGHFFDYSSK